MLPPAETEISLDRRPLADRTLSPSKAESAQPADVLRHLLGARPKVPARFPLTEQAFQAIARRLGYVVGQKRCRRMVTRKPDRAEESRYG
jgi:hypothetical protein